MAGVAHRVTTCYDCLLEDLDADAAARRVFERLFVLDGEVVLLETVKRGTESGEVRKQVCQGALTRKRTYGAAAHLSLVIFVSLRMAAIAVAPFSPTSLPERLPSEGRGAGMPRGDDTKANARELVREADGLLERLQRRVSL